MSLTGEADGPPTRVPAGLGDTTTGLHCAIGILAAVVQRQATGVGQQIEVSQQDTVVSLTRVHVREQYITGQAVARRGNRQFGNAPGQLLSLPAGRAQRLPLHPRGDHGHVAQALMRAIGRPDLADDSDARHTRGSATSASTRSTRSSRRGRRSTPSARRWRSSPAPAWPAARCSTSTEVLGGRAPSRTQA